MANLRRVKSLPIPGAELARLKETLHSHYGSTLHDSPETQEAVLVVRVPHDDPDMVNDVEHSIGYLNPAELQRATSCLFVGNTRTLEFPVQPLRELMAERVRFDRRQCHLLRAQLQPGEHRLFKSPEDPQRLLRLAVRVPGEKVGDLTEEQLVEIAQTLGPKLASHEYRDTRVVYLVATKDDVGMESDQFFQEVKARWNEESERRRLAEEIVRKEAARRLQEEAERRRLAPRERIALAPLRQPDRGAWESESMKTDPRREEMYARIDSLLGLRAPRGLARQGKPWRTESHPLPSDPMVSSAPLGGALAPSAVSAEPAPNPPHEAPGLPTSPSPQTSCMDEVAAALRAAGYEVLERPPGIHAIDLAAERVAFPSRVVVFCPERMDIPLADRVLAVAKALQVDLALVVTSNADPEARKRFIATRARWLDPLQLGELGL